ncbi:Ig-like domain-containing protein [Sphingomonas sp. J344]|uniref:Ig-like domain-containing protein n=1 Tax=unclassified Sphingomonas TaxID=196159 RepID=UPI0035AFC496
MPNCARAPSAPPPSPRRSCDRCRRRWGCGSVNRLIWVRVAVNPLEYLRSGVHKIDEKDARPRLRGRTKIARHVRSVGATALIGCSGGSTSQPGPAPVNRAPSFTSAAAVTVAENATGSVYQAAATDPDSDALTYSISGGADAARFAITAAGQLSFAASPNFDLPADSDLDNVYQITLSVSDGRASAQLAVTISVTNSREGYAASQPGLSIRSPLLRSMPQPCWSRSAPAQSTVSIR